MSTLPIICIITARGCSHCENMRRATILDNPGTKTISGLYSWDQSFFTKLLFGTKNPNPSTQNPKTEVYEVNFSRIRSAGIQDIQEFNIFKWNGVKVVKYSYQNDNGSCVEISDTSKITVSDNFNTYIASKVPSTIMLYIKMFPEFAIFDGKSWDDAIKGTGPLLGYVANCKTRSFNNGRTISYGVDKEIPSLPKVEDPVANIEAYLQNPISMLPINITIPPGLPDEHKTQLTQEFVQSQFRSNERNPINMGYLSGTTVIKGDTDAPIPFKRDLGYRIVGMD